MTRYEADALVRLAIGSFLKENLQLITLDVTERAISCKLAHCMSMSNSIRWPLSVDCEYNRLLGDPKRLNLPNRKSTDRETQATTVFPDIIVHERNSSENNLVVMELKKPGGVIDYDYLKLRAFQEELGYKYAAHVILGLGKDGRLINEVIWV